eukprot:TRINITY_DN7961_c0_g1_i1.p1 TRINITY_DN7961_c0_g1~~TRINITY_DN7961_c0_g1_i1.p1  ORF type:complete len:111 (+),score=7.60 TRINITY_DN7961_c0_g1_i1:15-347(+)
MYWQVRPVRKWKTNLLNKIYLHAALPHQVTSSETEYPQFHFWQKKAENRTLPFMDSTFKFQVHFQVSKKLINKALRTFLKLEHLIRIFTHLYDDQYSSNRLVLCKHQKIW